MHLYLNNPLVAKVLLVLGAIVLAVLSATVLKGTDLQTVFSHGASGLLTAALVQILPTAAKGPIARASVKPPSIVGLVLLVLLTGCAHGAAAPDWTNIRNHSNAMRVQVNDVVDELAGSAPLIDVACALRGRESATCRTLRGLWDVARMTVAGTQRAIDLYDATGLELDRAQRGVGRVVDAAEKLHDALEGVGKAVRDAVAQDSDRRVEGGGAADRPVPTEGEGSAPAQGEGQAAGDDRAGTPAPATAGVLSGAPGDGGSAGAGAGNDAGPGAVEPGDRARTLGGAAP